MTAILPSELTHHFSRAQVPDLDSSVIAATNETAAFWIKGQRAHEVIVSSQSADAFTSRRTPYLDLLVI